MSLKELRKKYGLTQKEAADIVILDGAIVDAGAIVITDRLAMAGASPS